MCRSTWLALACSSLLLAACDAPSEPVVRAGTHPSAARVAGARAAPTYVSSP